MSQQRTPVRRGRRRRRSKLIPIIIGLTLLLAALVAVAIFLQPEAPDPSETTPSDTVSTEGTAPESTPPTEGSTEPAPLTGWTETDGIRYYYLSDGTAATGWQDIDGNRYYFANDGALQTGWQVLEGITYYFLENGAMAKGQITIEGVNYFFTSTGAKLLVVNPWNTLPEDYAPDLVALPSSVAVENMKVDRSCYDALVEMINGCNAVCPEVTVISSFRSVEYQVGLYNKKVQYFRDLGYGEAEAKAKAATIVAVPGTSEHHTGLAVDIIDTRLWALEEEQENLPAQQWLMENAWRYGFILRYPKDKIEETGIIYEPWHYRYVGKELAKELHDLGVTVEEYIASLTK